MWVVGGANAFVANDLEKVTMSFGAPEWLWGLLLIPLLIALFVRAEHRGLKRLQQFVSARLLPQLAGTVNRPRRIIPEEPGGKRDRRHHRGRPAVGRIFGKHVGLHLVSDAATRGDADSALG